MCLESLHAAKQARAKAKKKKKIHQVVQGEIVKYILIM